MVGYRRTVRQQQEHATDRPSLGSPRPGGAKLTYLFPPTQNSPLHIGLPCSTGCLAGKCRRDRATMFFPMYRTYILPCACFKRFVHDAPRNRSNLAIATSFSRCKVHQLPPVYTPFRSSEKYLSASFLRTCGVLFRRIFLASPATFTDTRSSPLADKSARRSSRGVFTVI